jgi:hypothetical protein
MPTLYILDIGSFDIRNVKHSFIFALLYKNLKNNDRVAM